MTEDIEYQGEPTRFVWFRDGEKVVGTLAQWAGMWEGDYYAGENDLARTLLNWDGEPGTATYHQVQVVQGKADEREYIPYTITAVGTPDTAVIWIDGRA